MTKQTLNAIKNNYEGDNKVNYEMKKAFFDIYNNFISDDLEAYKEAQRIASTFSNCRSLKTALKCAEQLDELIEKYQIKDEEPGTNEEIINNNEEIIDKIDRIDADLYNMSIVTIKMYRDLMCSISEEIEDIINSEELTKNEVDSFKKLAGILSKLIYKIGKLINFGYDEQADAVEKIARIKYPKEYEYIDEVQGAAMERFKKLNDLL